MTAAEIPSRSLALFASDFGRLEPSGTSRNATECQFGNTAAPGQRAADCDGGPDVYERCVAKRRIRRYK